MVWAFDTPTTDTKTKVVLLALADHADDDNFKCWPSVERLAERTGLSRRSVYRAIVNLNEAGFIKYEQRRHTNGWKRQPLFTLNVPKPSATQSQPSANQSMPSATGGTTYEPSLNPQKEERGKSGLKQEGFKAFPHSPEFLSWKSYFNDIKKLSMVRELSRRELEGRAFDFESQWPPSKGASNVLHRAAVA